MKKISEWIHGRGRAVVIAAAVLAALFIVVDYAQNRSKYLSSDEPNPTVSPKAPEDDFIGGSKLSPASSSDAGSTPGELASPSASSGAVSKQPQDPSASSAAGSTPSEEAQTHSETEMSAVPDTEITLGFAGDISLDDTSTVMRHMREKGGLDKVISPALIKRMNGYDAMVINNEFSVSRRGRKMEGKAYTFRSRPSNLKYLKQLGVDVAGLANNHVYDYGEDAFYDTLRYLKREGFQTVGAGKNIEEAREPAYIEIGEKTVAVVAATRAEKNIYTPGAGKNSPGVFRTYDDRKYVREIERAKKKADFVVAYVHWGTEYSTVLEQAQTEQAKDYINAGADVVVGAHTHCLQGVGYYKGAPIFYSLGNFWFNSKTLYTTVLEIKIDGGGNLEARLVPCLQSGMETRILTKAREKKRFRKYINNISATAKLDGKCRVVKR